MTAKARLGPVEVKPSPAVTVTHHRAAPPVEKGPSVPVKDPPDPAVMSEVVGVNAPGATTLRTTNASPEGSDATTDATVVVGAVEHGRTATPPVSETSPLMDGGGHGATLRCWPELAAAEPSLAVALTAQMTPPGPNGPKVAAYWPLAPSVMGAFDGWPNPGAVHDTVTDEIPLTSLTLAKTWVRVRDSGQGLARRPEDCEMRLVMLGPRATLASTATVNGPAEPPLTVMVADVCPSGAWARSSVTVRTTLWPGVTTPWLGVTTNQEALDTAEKVTGADDRLWIASVRMAAPAPKLRRLFTWREPCVCTGGGSWVPGLPVPAWGVVT